MLRCQICCRDKETRQINIIIFDSFLIICSSCEKKIKDKILKMTLRADSPKKEKNKRINSSEKNMGAKTITRAKFIEGHRVQRLHNVFDSSSEMMFGNIIKAYSEPNYPELYDVKWDFDEAGTYLPHGIEL